jgi:hypothetical protein
MNTLKVLLSPSKTQNLRPTLFKDSPPVTSVKFKEQTNLLLQQIKKYDKTSLGERLHIKGKILDETYALYQKWDSKATNHAICLYSGLVFKGLTLSQYSKSQLQYISDHLCVLSAFYGVLSPFDVVRPYRLDMKSNVFASTSYEYWEDAVNNFFTGQDILINLASEEFSKLITKPMVDIQFKCVSEAGELITKSTHAKMARGQMAHYIITHELKRVEALKKFQWNGYKYSEKESSPSRYVFVNWSE